jgi:hypothetical protein
VFRGECERFFCESLRAVFLGERDAASRDSDWSGVSYTKHTRHAKPEQRAIESLGQLTPPDEYPFPDVQHQRNSSVDSTTMAPTIEFWLHIYDHIGGASFAAFVASGSSNQRSLFVFFDETVIKRDLKKA